MTRIQPIRASDVPAVVGVHLRAFPGFFLSELGAPFLRQYYRAFVTGGRRIGLVAFDEEGRVSGFVVGAVNPRGFYRELLRSGWLRFGMAALPAVARDPRRLLRVARAVRHPGGNAPDPHAVGLFSIAVDPVTQSRGVGTELLREFVNSAREQEGRIIFLTTDTDDNEPTNAFYHRRGFQLVRRFRTPEGRLMNEYALKIVSQRSHHND